jgi:hypothetical protein
MRLARPLVTSKKSVAGPSTAKIDLPTYFPLVDIRDSRSDTGRI